MVAYDKTIKDNLSEPMERLEFSFSGAFFKDMYLKDLPKAIEKMEKAIKKKIGVTVKINPLFSHA